MSIIWTPLRLTMSAEVEEERQRKPVRRFISIETMEQGTQTDIVGDVDAVARNQVVNNHNHKHNNNNNNNSRQLYFTSDKETLNKLLSSTDSNEYDASTLPKSKRNKDNEIVVEEIEITPEYKSDLKSKKINNEDSIDVLDSNLDSNLKKIEEIEEKESCCTECIFFAIDCCGCTII